jgi:hypothetical protein
VSGVAAGQKQMLALLHEIERQANAGISYAMSSDHLLDEPAMQEAIASLATRSQDSAKTP